MIFYPEKKYTIAIVSLIAVIAVLTVSILILNSGDNSAHANVKKVKPERIKTVKGYKIKAVKEAEKYSFPAAIKSERDVKISFRVGGPIVKFFAETGKKVKKGELIAQIDTRDFEVNVKSIQATLEASRARLKDAELQYKRYKSLLKENAASKASYDRYEASFKASKSQMIALKASLAKAQNALKDTKLLSPMDGYINSVFTESHETVAAGQPIVSIVDSSSIEIETFLPEQLIMKKESFSNFTFTLTTEPEKKYTAKIKEIGEKATGAGHTYPVILKAVANIAKPGMSAVVNFTIPLDTKDSVLTVPLSSIVSKNYENAMVWKINTKEITPVPVKITVLKIIDKKMADVKGDLKSGDWIVSAGANYLHNDSKIVLLPDFSKTNIGEEL